MKTRRNFLQLISALFVAPIFSRVSVGSQPDKPDNLSKAINPERSKWYSGKKQRSVISSNGFWERIYSLPPCTFGELVYADNDTYCMGQQWMVFGWCPGTPNSYEEFLVPCDVSELRYIPHAAGRAVTTGRCVSITLTGGIVLGSSESIGEIKIGKTKELNRRRYKLPWHTLQRDECGI